MKCSKMGMWQDTLTVNEAKQQKAFIKAMKDDWKGFTVKEFATAAMRRIAENDSAMLDRVIDSEMEAIRNNNVPWDNFGDGCGVFDGWISATAKCYSEEGQPLYIEAGFHLSDAIDVYNGELDRLINRSGTWYYKRVYKLTD